MIEHFSMARKIVASMTTDSWKTVPHVVVTYETDVTKLLEFIDKTNADIQGKQRLTINTVMLKVISEALKACPRMNSHIEYNHGLVRGKVKELESIDISLPMILSSGEMMTLNVHNVGNLSFEEISAEITELKEKADNSVLTEAFYEVSMDNCISEDDKISVGKILTLTVAFDHRAMDFGDITPFMNKLDELFSDTLWMSSCL